jgi:hypothetical protein
MRAITLALPILVISVITGCGSDNPAPNPEPKPQAEPPVAGTLVFPENLSECTEGELVSDTQSRILFQWTSGANTDSFTLEVLDVTANSKNTINTENTEALLTLTRGNQFSWRVISRNTGSSETATTATWHFYNAGIAQSNYAPFPAELTAPISGSTRSKGPVLLEWKGSDLDAESLNYSILLDTANPPSTEVGSASQERFTIALTTPGIYFWRIRSTDISGNSSLSEISQFKVE